MIRLCALTLACAAGIAVSAAQAQRADTLRIGIADAVSYVLRSSDENKLALYNVDIADATAVAARSASLPQIGFNGHYQQVLKNARGEIVGSVFGQSYTYQGSAAVTQALFQGGRIFSAARAGLRARSSARFDAGETRARLAVDVQRLYINALYFAKIADLQDRSLALSTSRLEQVEQLVAAGRSSRYDLLRARVDRSNIEPLALQAASNREITLLDVRRLLDVPPDRPVVLTTAFDSITIRTIVSAAAADSAVAGVRGSVQSAELTLLALILASLFGSFLQPLAIILALPLSLLGVTLALFVTRGTFNVMSMIGIIMLMGLVTKNGILLIDFVNQRRAAGEARLDAILESGRIRLRPILMTTIAMIFGMLPLALALGEGGVSNGPRWLVQ